MIIAAEYFAANSKAQNACEEANGLLHDLNTATLSDEEEGKLLAKAHLNLQAALTQVEIALRFHHQAPAPAKKPRQKKERVIMAWEGNTPLYATEKNLRWQEKCSRLRERLESLSPEHLDYEQAKQDYLDALCEE